jgi:hypothetical protein
LNGSRYTSRRVASSTTLFMLFRCVSDSLATRCLRHAPDAAGLHSSYVLTASVHILLAIDSSCLTRREAYQLVSPALVGGRRRTRRSESARRTRH